MAVKRYRSLNPARRNSTRTTRDWLTKKKPEKSLTRKKSKTGGRNSKGRITVRHRGGGSKQKLRVLDFKRIPSGPAEVSAIEYAPGRSANIALIEYKDGRKDYIIHPDGLKVGDTVESSDYAPLQPGNARPLKYIPEGAAIHNVELRPGQGGVMVRGAGGEASVTAKEKDYVLVKFPSGEVRKIKSNCRATLGKVGNADHFTQKLGFAGATRHRGQRPRVRGTAMNSVDHPHGGGRGKSKGNNLPSNPWGKKCKGVKTRKKKKASTRDIIKRRK
ncbi:MAG: 50S ribosomal protein L2 [Elusimicrobiota bacterium]